MINRKIQRELVQKPTSLWERLSKKYFLRFHDFGRKSAFVIQWDDKSIIVLFFFTFGFYGWGTTQGLSSITSVMNLTTTLAFLTSSIILYLRRHDYNSYFKIKVEIELRHLVAVLAFLIIGIAFNFNRLNRSLTVDELAYAWSSQLHSYVLVNKLFHLFPSSLGSVNSQYVVQIFSILIIVCLVTFLSVLWHRSTDFGFYFYLSLVTLIVRFSIQYSGGIDWPNSPFGHIWHFFFSSLFGVSNSSFRISNLLLFAVIASIIYFYTGNYTILTKLLGFVSAILLFTVPLLNSLSTSLEIASWSLLFTLICFGSLVRSDFTFTFKLLMLLAVGYYFRVNLIALFIAYFIALLIFKKTESRDNRWGFYFPLLVVSPGLFPVLLNRLLGRLEDGNELLLGIRRNFENSIDSITNSGSGIYVLLFLLSTAVLLFYKKSIIFSLTYILLQLLLFFVLNSPSISGSSKYLAEYFFPYVVFFGMLPILFRLQKSRSVLILSISLLLAFNSYGLFKSQDIPRNFKSIYDPSRDAISSGFGAVPYTPFPYADVFKFIRTKDIQSCFNAGVVYSEIPRVLAGVSISEVSVNASLRSRFLSAQSDLGEDWRTISLASVSSSSIKCVILGAVDQPLRIQRELTAGGWSTVAVFVERIYGTKVYLMTKY